MKNKIRLKRKNNFINIQNIIIFTIILILVVSYYLCYIFSLKSKNVLNNYIESDLKQLSNYYVNDIISEMVVDNESINNLSKVIKNSKGDIVSIEYDTLTLNHLLTKVNEKLYSNFNNIKFNNLLKTSKDNIYYIPFGVFSNIMVFEELGPKIPIKVFLTKNISSNIKTNIENYGINNALIKVYLEVKLNQKIILPFVSKNIRTNDEILLSVKLIQGNIPSSYGNLYTYSSNIKELN